ncbi:MAG: pyridoxal phosphate-dependent aminotransferase, partial [Halobaculum sp.]
MFSTLPYLDWIRGRPETATHDLGSSDLRPGGPPSDPELVPPRLRDLPESDDERSVAAAVAAEYGVSESEVLVTAGATHANFLVAATAVALTRDRSPETAADPVALVEDPGYGPLVRTPESVGARVERFARPDGRLDPERVIG